MLNLQLRRGTLKDLPELHQLFADTISTICAIDYDNEQLDAWISRMEDKERWKARIEDQHFVVAESDSGIVGFASLQNASHIDVLFVHKDYQKKGIASKLLHNLEAYATRPGKITSDVSITARPFFEQKGFSVVAEQINTLNGVQLINYQMVKPVS